MCAIVQIQNTGKRQMMISGKYRKFRLEKAPPGREPVIPATES